MSTDKIKRSGTTTSTPSSLDHGELAINYADATLFWKDDANVIQSFVFQAYASATHKSTHATGGSDALSPSDIGAAPAASPTFTGNATFDASSGVPVTITNTGSGNSFVVNDASGDATPFVIGNNGFVGIGSEPTTRRLTVRGESTGDGAVLLQSSSTGTGTSNGFIIQCFGASSDAYVWNFENAPIIFGANNGERMRLYADGKLDVTNSIWVVNGSASSPGFTFRNDTNTGIFQASGAADTLSISTAGSERVRVDIGGRVGIGHTTPSDFNQLVSGQHLVVGNGANAPGVTVYSGTGNSGTIAFADGTATTDQYRGAVSYSHAADALRFFAASTERARISSNGHLGIGTTSPTSRLDVNGVITVSAGTAAAPAIVASGDPNTGLLWPAADTFAISTAGSERVRVDASGRVGIGTTTLSPWNQLVNGEHLVVGSGASGLATGLTLYSGTNGSGAVAFADGTTTTDQYRGALSYSHTLDAMRLWTAATVRVNIDSSGNVGIGTGTTTPASRLDVNGVITVSATSGSAGSYLPSLCFASDPNTGLGQVGGADSVSLITAGSERVQVKSTGAVRFVPLSADPASGEAGDVYYNSTDNKLRVYNGTSWIDLH